MLMSFLALSDMQDSVRGDLTDPQGMWVDRGVNPLSVRSVLSVTGTYLVYSECDRNLLSVL